MSKLIIRNAGPLYGAVEVSGSKNSVLPLLASTLLTEDTCEIGNVPDLNDVDVMCELLRAFGAEVNWDKTDRTITVCAKTLRTSDAPCELVKQMRASILAMGPVLARAGAVLIPLPGGCAIGDRPINLHIKGFIALDAEVTVNEDSERVGFVEAKASSLKGAEIYLDTPSVGATENIIMAAALAEGTTIIENAAQEPEIVDLANYLNKMGARIKGAGTDQIKIEGVTSLHGAVHSVIPDRIEAGTFMLAAAITRGDLLISNMLSNHLVPVIAKLRECGVQVEETDDNTVRVNAGKSSLIAADISTLPYPGFPTDIQPQFMSFLCTVSGPSTVLETVFEDRFKHITELIKMNASIIENGRKAIIAGGSSLKGASVTATDLRAGAALILAGLVADGTTEISDIYHIYRGYDGIEHKLAGLGAYIKKMD